MENPKVKNDYLCKMSNGYIKMCFWTGSEWIDMWETDLKGSVTEWIEVPDFNTEEAGLKESLKDKDIKMGWVANIATAQLDNERWYREKHDKVGKYLNYKDRHAIANLGAEYFIKILCK